MNTTLMIVSVCPQHCFPVFVFYAWFGILLKSMVQSSLLSKDETQTPNIDKVMAIWILRRRALKTKIGKFWTSRFLYIIFSRSTQEEICLNFYREVFRRFLSWSLKFLVKNLSSVVEKINRPTLYSSFPSIFLPNLAQYTLCRQFEDQTDMYLVLRVFSLIRRSHFYDAEPIFNH